jgi:hypothetical protein
MGTTPHGQDEGAGSGVTMRETTMNESFHCPMVEQLREWREKRIGQR